MFEKLHSCMFTQKEFDQFVSNYIVEGVLPLNHVEMEYFKELMQQSSPGKLAKHCTVNKHIHTNLYTKASTFLLVTR